MSSPVVALKVDVGTYTGTRDGVPRLISILDRLGVRATFYFAMGPDNSGKAIRRIFTRRGFLEKMLRTRTAAAYGLKTLFYGTLLPAPLIAASLPHILLETEKRGHEVGIHGWDPVKWHDLLPWFPKPVTAMELGKASSQFESIFGRRAKTTAAPGWTVSADSLEVQDAMELAYCSDCRGTHPFYPLLAGRAFQTLQLPTTWPTVDELLGEHGITAATINDHYLSLLSSGLQVHTIHAEIEGRLFADVFADLLQRLLAAGVRFVTLAEAAEEFGKPPRPARSRWRSSPEGPEKLLSRQDAMTGIPDEIVRYFLVDRRDLVYLKFILEAYEGMSTMTTVQRDGVVVRLTIPAGFAADMQALLEDISADITLKETTFVEESNLHA